MPSCLTIALLGVGIFLLASIIFGIVYRWRAWHIPRTCTLSELGDVLESLIPRMYAHARIYIESKQHKRKIERVYIERLGEFNTRNDRRCQLIVTFPNSSDLLIEQIANELSKAKLDATVDLHIVPQVRIASTVDSEDLYEAIWRIHKTVLGMSMDDELQYRTSGVIMEPSFSESIELAERNKPVPR